MVHRKRHTSTFVANVERTACLFILLLLSVRLTKSIFYFPVAWNVRWNWSSLFGLHECNAPRFWLSGSRLACMTDLLLLLLLLSFSAGLCSVPGGPVTSILNEFKNQRKKRWSWIIFVAVVFSSVLVQGDMRICGRISVPETARASVATFDFYLFSF